jgi:hypothetical protein
MEMWHIVLWGLAALGAAAGFYALHRLCLWLEARGWLYYKHKKRSTSPMSCMVALQQALEPRAEHVRQIAEHRQAGGEQGPPHEGGAGDQKQQ